VNKLQAIFEEQRRLMSKYHAIQEFNGFEPPHPDLRLIGDAHYQYYVKFTLWCIVEELAEAMNTPGGWQSTSCQDELSDAFHFLVELAILCGVVPSQITSDDLGGLFAYSHSHIFSRDPQLNMAFLVSGLGMVGHALRNKPWKQTKTVTDIDLIHARVVSSFHKFVALCISVGIDAARLYELYMHKNAVNQKRQENKY